MGWVVNALLSSSCLFCVHIVQAALSSELNVRCGFKKARWDGFCLNLKRKRNVQKQAEKFICSCCSTVLNDSVWCYMLCIEFIRVIYYQVALTVNVTNVPSVCLIVLLCTSAFCKTNLPPFGMIKICWLDLKCPQYPQMAVWFSLFLVDFKPMMRISPPTGLGCVHTQLRWGINQC